MSTPHPRDQAVETLMARQLAALEAGPGSPCPDAEMMAAWMEHGLDAAAQSRVELHVSSCARCQALAAALAGSEPVAEAVAPWWRRFDVRWLAPLSAAAAATLLWTIAPSSPERGTAEPADTMARVEAPAPLTEEAARPSEPAKRGRDAGTEVPALQDQTSTLTTPAPQDQRPARTTPALQDQTPTLEEKVTAQPREVAAGGENVAALQGKVAAAEEAQASEARALERQSAAREAAPLAKAQPAVPAQPAAAPPARVAESAPAPAPPVAAATPGAPAAFAGAARAEAPARWRVADGRVERGAPAGDEWTTVPTEQPVTAVAGVTAPVAWAVGRGGLVLRTLDGRTWTRTTAPTTDDLAGVTADDARSATVRSVAGTLYRTTDGGATWAPVP